MGSRLRALRGRDAAGPGGGADFDALFRSCAGDVHAYAIALLGDPAAAEDVTALAFERLYRARDRLDPRRGTARGLLFTIARNAALDELRRRARRPPAKDDPELVADSFADDALAQVEQRALVAEALAGLNPRQRELVLLKFHGQFTNGELARVLGTSESNVGTRLHRAMTRLRTRCLQLERERAA
jgi:RNA polymerase sigma factor (sigma-70 family)